MINKQICRETDSRLLAILETKWRYHHKVLEIYGGDLSSLSSLSSQIRKRPFLQASPPLSKWNVSFCFQRTHIQQLALSRQLVLLYHGVNRYIVTSIKLWTRPGKLLTGEGGFPRQSFLNLFTGDTTQYAVSKHSHLLLNLIVLSHSCC